MSIIAKQGPQTYLEKRRIPEKGNETHPCAMHEYSKCHDACTGRLWWWGKQRKRKRKFYPRVADCASGTADPQQYIEHCGYFYATSDPTPHHTRS